MEIGRFVTRAVLTVSAEDTLQAAAESMMERGVGSAVVMEAGKPSGVITDREGLRAIAQHRDPDSYNGGQVCKRQVDDGRALHEVRAVGAVRSWQLGLLRRRLSGCGRPQEGQVAPLAQPPPAAGAR